jgi:ADP-ribose pyrophosphatase YjhB (NUDIX family)
MSTERERSFGGVVVRDGEVLVITPAGRPQISTLPKGGPQDGEPPEVTAAREVREETGVEARIVEHLGDYISGDTADHDHEVEEARWMPLELALTELTYPGERLMIERALSKHTGSM